MNREKIDTGYRFEDSGSGVWTPAERAAIENDRAEYLEEIKGRKRDVEAEAEIVPQRLARVEWESVRARPEVDCGAE